MKKILLLFAAAVCAVASWAADATVSATVKGQKLEVALANDAQAFVAFQMDITLPAGVDVEAAGAVVMNTDRLTEKAGTPVAGAANANFIIAYNKIDATHVRVLAYNLENRAITGKEGALFNMTFTGTPAAKFVLDNVLFVTTSDLEEVKLQLAESTSASVLIGDVNKDGRVSVTDIACVVEIINGDAEGKDYDLTAADANGDNRISVTDITVIVEIINNQE